MAAISKPDYSYIWSSGGALVAPSNVKIQTGWTAEVPPFQWENWSQNRQDQAIAHVFQYGIAVWDNSTEYQSGKSYVQGSDGLIYKALTTHTNINPVGGTAGNWESAFITASQAVQAASEAQARAMTANNVYISPLQLANAFTGTNQQIAESGFQHLPGGLLIQWGPAQAATGGSITFPKPFPNNVFSIQVQHGYGANNPISTAISSTTTSSFTILTSGTGSLGFRFFAIGN